MSRKRILIVDDEKNMRHMLSVMLSKADYRVEDASDGDEALRKMEDNEFDVILCDVRMPRMDGMTFLRKARDEYPHITYIMMSAYGTIESAVEAMKEGAYDYISKPFKPDEVLLTLKKAEERERLKEENLQLRNRISEIEEKYSYGNIVARSEAMARVFGLVRAVADHSTTVLITGESGTGKELIARAIHSNGCRASGPLVTIDCGGIPENLLESELFGYKKGAFTDAFRDKPGRFKKADGGTLFLDEIGELPLALQVKLLRVLQESEITPLGDTNPCKIDVRVVSATAKDLEKAVEEGNFREDLFYRINVMHIHIPPLRERRGDIALLVGHFIDLFNKKLNKTIEGPSSDAMAVLMDYPWPGNVRELENVMERAILLAEGRWLTPAQLPPALTQAHGLPSDPESRETLSIKKASRRLQRDLIIKALRRTEGNRTQAAKLLEISRPMLLSKIKEYDVEL
jgi:two-component system response regulator AtoC